ncbi:MAG TPA: glycoside hydrolase domain-containing protein [Gaiellaceae bacterium]|nr:glycoside hydrolase domain-containing protein [Gaiellaceae bacterium]
MPREGIDYAWHNGVDTDAFRSVGATFVVRYLSHDPRKNLSAAEAQVLSDAGFDVAVVWESSARRACAGQPAGAADAHAAAVQAKACGMPAARPIYFGVDFDAGDGDKPKIVDYLQGAASVLGAKRVGVYGGYWVVKYCFDHSAARFGWQTYAWSAGHRDRRAQLYQHENGVTIGGISCDRDTAYAADFGQWRLPPQCSVDV